MYRSDIPSGRRAEIIGALQASYDAWNPEWFELEADGAWPKLGTLEPVSALNWCQRAAHLILSPRSGREESDRGLGKRMILRAIHQAQHRETGHPADGVFHWFVSDAPPDSFPSDRNTPGFYGVAILIAWLLDERKFDDWSNAEMRVVKDAVRRAWDASVRWPVRIGYTNPQTLDFFLGWAAADLLEDPSLRAYCRSHLSDFLEFTRAVDSVEEFVSPTYMAVNLYGITPLAHLSAGTPDEPLVRQLLELQWDLLAKSAHAPTAEICFPQCRAYADSAIDLPGHTYGWLNLAAPDVYPLRVVSSLEFSKGWKGDGGTATFPAGVFAGLVLPGLYCPLHIPDAALREIRGGFVSAPVEHRETTEWIGRCGWEPPYDLTKPEPPAPRFRLITRYKTDRYCVGSVNEIDCWQQRRGIGAYWNDETGRTTGVIFRLMLDIDPEDALPDDLAPIHRSDWALRQSVELIAAQDGACVIGAFRSATVLPYDPDIRPQSPSRVMTIGQSATLVPIDPVAWLAGTHWRQPIERAARFRMLKRMALRITPIGTGRWEALNESGTCWRFACHGTEAVFEIPNGASIISATLPPLQTLLGDSGGGREVQQLELAAKSDFKFDWLNPPAWFSPFSMTVYREGESRRFALNASGTSESCRISFGDDIVLEYRAVSRADRISERTWRANIRGQEVLPNGYDT